MEEWRQKSYSGTQETKEHGPALEKTLPVKHTAKAWSAFESLSHQSHPTHPFISPSTPISLMYKRVLTLRWGHVQTRERREKGCPQYRVFGSLRFLDGLCIFWGLFFFVVFLAVNML